MKSYEAGLRSKFAQKSGMQPLPPSEFKGSKRQKRVQERDGPSHNRCKEPSCQRWAFSDAGYCFAHSQHSVEEKVADGEVSVADWTIAHASAPADLQRPVRCLPELTARVLCCCAALPLLAVLTLFQDLDRVLYYQPVAGGLGSLGVVVVETSAGTLVVKSSSHIEADLFGCIFAKKVSLAGNKTLAFAFAFCAIFQLFRVSQVGEALGIWHAPAVLLVSTLLQQGNHAWSIKSSCPVQVQNGSDAFAQVVGGISRLAPERNINRPGKGGVGAPFYLHHTLYCVSLSSSGADAGRVSRLKGQQMLLIMEFVPGQALQDVFGAELACTATPELLRDLGAVVFLDMLLNNWDRISFPGLWNNDGNPANLIVSGSDKGEHRVNLIDQAATPLLFPPQLQKYLASCGKVVSASMANAHSSAGSSPAAPDVGSSVKGFFQLHLDHDIGAEGEKNVREGFHLALERLLLSKNVDRASSSASVKAPGPTCPPMVEKLLRETRYANIGRGTVALVVASTSFYLTSERRSRVSSRTPLVTRRSCNRRCA